MYQQFLRLLRKQKAAAVTVVVAHVLLGTYQTVSSHFSAQENKHMLRIRLKLYTDKNKMLHFRGIYVYIYILIHTRKHRLKEQSSTCYS